MSSTTCELYTLPDEVLLEIFEFIKRPDLLSLTQTCEKFNSLISTSTQLLSKFELHFTIDNFDREWLCTRKYSSAFIDKMAARHFLYIIAKIGGDFKSLVFNCDKTDVMVVKNVLLMCPNLKKLWVYNFEKDEDFYPDELGDPRPVFELDLFHFQGEVSLKVFD